MKPIDSALSALARLRQQIASVMIGQTEVIDLTLLALLCEGHVLLEGVPGLGKTLLVRTLAQALALQSARIQFTPDLMPADILGSPVLVQNPTADYSLRFEPGPLFANLILADEINRASPKTQSALLEAMQEQAVTVRGQTYPLPRPFQVLATQNPLEMEGTYPLPEAQIDRFFFKIVIDQPPLAELMQILDLTSGPPLAPLKPVLTAPGLRQLQKAVRDVIVPEPVLNFAARVVLASQPQNPTAPAAIRRFVRFGAGPRGAQTLVWAAKARALMQGRFHASLEDLRACALPALRHRLALNFEGQGAGQRIDSLILDLLDAVAATPAWPTALQPEGPPA